MYHPIPLFSWRKMLINVLSSRFYFTYSTFAHSWRTTLQECRTALCSIHEDPFRQLFTCFMDSFDMRCQQYTSVIVSCAHVTWLCGHSPAPLSIPKRFKVFAVLKECGRLLALNFLAKNLPPAQSSSVSQSTGMGLVRVAPLL